jgi:hypothetical protein
MDNRNREFVPVQPKAKGFNVDKKVDRFPGQAVVTLSEVKEKVSKMLILSDEAIKALGLTETDNRIAIVRGHIEGEGSPEAMFIYRTDAETYEFVNDKEHRVKMDSARTNLNTRRAMSAKFHGIISARHSEATSSDEKHFRLVERYGDRHWRLEEYRLTDEADNTIRPTAEETSAIETSVSAGETVEVTVD